MPKNSALVIDLGQGLSILTSLLTIPSWDTASRPKNARKGTFGFNSQTNSLEYWDGDVWFSVAMAEA